MDNIIQIYEQNKVNRDDLLAKIDEVKKDIKLLKHNVKELTERKKIIKDRYPKCPQPPILEFEYEQAIGIIVCVILGVLLLLHWILLFFGWIFNADWGVWNWITFVFKWGIIVVIACAIFNMLFYVIKKSIYKRSIEDYKNAQKELTKIEKSILSKNKKISQQEHFVSESTMSIEQSTTEDIRDLFSIPIANDAIKITDNYRECIKQLDKLIQLEKKIANLKDDTEKRLICRNIVDDKLTFFYKYSIKGECKDAKLYDIYKSQYSKALSAKDANLLRLREEQYISVNKLTFYQPNLDEMKELLLNNKMEPILRNLKDVQSRDVSGIVFPNLDALSTKTEDMHKLFKAAQYEYSELSNINERINRALNFTRICAYKNIYLGIELINFIRVNSGGKTLTTEKDYINVAMEGLKAVDISGMKLNMDTLSNISFSINNILESFQDKDVAKFAVNNPKIALGAAAINIIGNFISERSEAIESNNSAQETIIENLQKMYNGYIEGQSSCLRAIELIKSIIKANDGFMSIYLEKKEKVFEKNQIQEITKKDVQELALAIMEYKKISSSKI